MNPYVAIRDLNPCPSCGSRCLQFTRVQHRDTKVHYFSIWCDRCEFSPDHYVVGFERAAKEWNDQWETKT